jgi:branched-chain amino acid transport system substrate-binding protein
MLSSKKVQEYYMKRRSRTFLQLFTAIVLLISLVSCGKAIKIGFIGPLTGEAGNYGKLMTQAIKIAVDDVNKEGGIAGMKVTLVAEDSEGKPDKATAAAEKLIGIEKVHGIVGAVFSSSSLAIAPRCEAAKTVLISPSSTHADLTGKGDYIFRTIFSDSLQASVFAKYVKNRMNIDRVAILHLKNDYSQGIAEEFQAQYTADGGIITSVQSALQDDKDFKTQLTTIKDTNPQALFMPNYVAECARYSSRQTSWDLIAPC